MSRRILAPALAVAWAVGLGFFVAILDGQQQQFSVEVWLAVGGSLVIADLAWRMVRSAGTSLVDRPAGERSAGQRLLSVIRRLARWVSGDGSTPGSVDDSELPMQLRSSAAMLQSSYENERHFKRRLQPRLRVLADHYLPLRHGVDPSDAAAVERVLGSVSWLVDSGSHSTADSRPPTDDEVTRFMRSLLDEPTSESSAT